MWHAPLASQRNTDHACNSLGTYLAAVLLTGPSSYGLRLYVPQERHTRPSVARAQRAGAKFFACGQMREILPSRSANVRNLAAGANARNFRAVQIHTTYPCRRCAVAPWRVPRPRVMQSAVCANTEMRLILSCSMVCARMSSVEFPNGAIADTRNHVFKRKLYCHPEPDCTRSPTSTSMGSSCQKKYGTPVHLRDCFSVLSSVEFAIE